MWEQIAPYVYSGLGVIITGLCTWLSAYLVQLINSKIKDKNIAKWLNQITTIVFACVKQVYQVYVESLKASGKFDADAQKTALDSALTEIKSELSDDAKKFITDNYGDMEAWLKTQIESAIYTLKNDK
jgi:hypothetical protein